MKLLICTQTLDRRDPVLGFFHRWVTEFAGATAQVTVICLNEGEHVLPSNVRVYSLGKEAGPRSRLTYAIRFWRILWRIRHDYDAVFVHMNVEYVLLGGLCWRVLRKRVALWYTHKSVTLRLRLATMLSHVVLTASEESFRLRTRKLKVIGHGIDTDFFSLAERGPGLRVLSAGRLSPTKRHDFILRAVTRLPEEAEVRIVGDSASPADEKYAASLRTLTTELGIHDRVTFVGALTQTQLREEYHRAHVFAHASQTGSLDKVVLEALATGLPVVSTSEAFRALLRPWGLHASDDIPDFADRLLAATRKPGPPLRAVVQEEHSLVQCIHRILTEL